jgi:putative copper export protein
MVISEPWFTATYWIRSTKCGQVLDSPDAGATAPGLPSSAGVTAWTVIRFLHLLAIAFFVGGQLVLVAAVTPVLSADRERMRAVARRFGIGSAIALAVIVVTGAGLASHVDRWGDSTLHAKLALLVLVFALTGAHVFTNRVRAISLGIVVVSLAIFYLGVELAHG